MPPPRSRSVMSTSTRLPDDPPTREPTPTLPLKHSKHIHDDAETNIRVVIRCRRRSEREIQDNSPIIVTSNGAKSKDVSVQMSTPVSSLGVVTLPPLRTYPFDLVFGPEADQAAIYHNVVSPMLDEVLMGYNCTLFAYGQTGTGKTYTMQGDLTPTPMGNPSPDAGMIPRVLFRLFHHLETSQTDYSVKISYIELYNEELRDLLANELSAPTGNTQPMGLGGKDTSKDANKNVDGCLKIFDDATKRGVMIQGLEEIAVKDCRDALALLTKGSHRRQIAATKFNDHSSRSHSVFSITVHVKESSTIGEDLLKIGKLNLVDLAGSENIGRSGAENKRAREAGMINQSLLTLGRVINALVDKAQHIPYRESKLTRLLQDSLGGRTKTCIIATISPARSNMEETLSTLDYALRAKSIRNKPEVNQRMTRNALLKEYVAEIERLKSDLLAAREKNGIFFSEETWNQMAMEQELRSTELEEAKKQAEIVENQMRAVQEEFEQSIGLLKIREGELSEMRETLKDMEYALGRKEEELETVKGALEEEVVMRKAHQDTEIILDGVAIGLRNVAQQSVCDVSELLQKLERKTIVLKSNSHAVSANGRTIATSAHTLSQKLDDFVQLVSHSTLKVQNETQDFRTKELEKLSSYTERVDQQLLRLQNTLLAIQSSDASEAEALGIARKVLGETHQTFKTSFGAWSEHFKRTSEELSKGVKMAGMDVLGAVEAELKTMGSLIDIVIREARDHIDADLETVRAAKTLTSENCKNEVARLRQQNETLAALLESERLKVDNAKDELVRRLSVFLGNFTVERDRTLREALGAIQGANHKREGETEVFAEQHGKLMEQIQEDGTEVNGQLQKRSGEGKRTRDGAFKILNNAKSTLRRGLENMQGTTSDSITSYMTQLQTQTDKMSSTCADAFEQQARVKRARIEATTSLGADVLSEYRHMQRGFALTSANIETMGGLAVSESSKLANATETYQNVASNHLGTLQAATKALTEQGTQEDSPTGTTPRKRTWDYVDKWKLTERRDDVLRAWREQGTSNIGRETFLAEHLPLPEGDDGMDEDMDMKITEIECPVEPENILTGSPGAPSSLSSSDSSLSILKVAPPLQLKKVAGPKTGNPLLGTLTDSRNVYTTRRSRRAR